MTTATDTASERRAKEIERLENAVNALYSSDGWERWIRVRSNFRTYSFRNQLLVALQCPEASQVAGFKTWKRLGRTVSKGSKAIWILAPCMIRATVEQQDEQGEAEAVTVRRVTGFRAVPVFDVSQTTGEDLPTPCETVEGSSHADYLPALEAFAATLGYAVHYLPIASRANGYCDTGSKRIVIDAALPTNQQLKTLVHEIAHALGITYENHSRADAEVIVEAAAWLVCGSLGLDTSTYSVGYLATWAEGIGAAALKTHAGTIDAIARTIEGAMVAVADTSSAIMEAVAA